MPDLVHDRLNGMFIIALLVAFLYWVVVFRSRFGFQLRASGLNPIAARTAGIPANRMVLIAMMLSGAVAGLVAMPAVIGDVYGYGPSAIATQFGFAGISVALLGRNHPIGIVGAALLFGFRLNICGASAIGHTKFDRQSDSGDHSSRGSDC